ncbi:hypothetical protein ILUMI_09950 [Ignelater luminosus]|uniref:Hexamerin n=1 Tax=Ignelater luminosus TaxID=2038154 RepID=A0A8K0D1C8_IGNLU|nr:hypothetical protein ILUMI_09950 [Ignelater luminosus]
MKIAVVILAGLCAIALADRDGQVYGQVPFKTADKQHNQIQHDILRLYKYVNQPSYYKDHVEIANSYSLEANIQQYSKPEVVEQFLYYYQYDIIPRDHIFSVFHEEHLKQAIALFRVFYYAKNYDTFYKTAVWARNHVNQGLFLYSFSVAVLHYPATYGIILPPIYEVYPYYFYNAEVIQQAQQYKQQYGYQQQQQQQHQQQDGYSGYTIRANYSGYYLNVHPEQSLSYYTEDVGINAYYYYYNLYRPYWLNYEDVYVNTYNRGEEYYYFYQQFLARYYLERLSNDEGEIKVYDYEEPLETGYYPTLVYPNGLAFPQRPSWAEFGKNYYNYGQSYSYKSRYGYSYDIVQDYERRIRDAIDAGYVKTEDGKVVNLFEEYGFNTLGNIIEANPESPNSRYYGYLQVFARHLLGYAQQPLHKYQVAPSALEHFETSLRDPVFYQFYKRIVIYFQKYKNYLPHYNKTDLEYPGVKVEGVQVDRLVTYFENVDADVSNAYYVNEEEYQNDNYHIRVRQQRLNRKPFTYKINVVSEKPVEAVVRVFIGPKYDEYGRHISINENRVNYVEFDTFRYQLQAGKNVIERNSEDNYYSDDYVSQYQLYQQVNSGKDYQVYGQEVQYTYPTRYLLPKGKRGGQTYQIYVIVSQYKAPDHQQEQQKQQQQHQHQYQQYVGQGQEQRQTYYYPIVGLGVPNIDDYPLGYPFDRPISQKEFYVPNSYFQDVVIYHKHANEINASNQPQDYESAQYYSANQNYGYNHNYIYNQYNEQ